MRAGPGGKRSRVNLSRRSLFALGGGLALAACTTDQQSPSTAKRDLTTLRSAVRGHVLLPGDAGFDRARTPWNLTVDQSVRAVVELADADDAADLIAYANESSHALTVQPNGHSPSPAVQDTILVRTNQFNELRIDPDNRCARVGPGISWGQVQAKASAHGLTALAGSSPAVGVTGYTLGGGLSWFARRFGWACDSVTAFDIVDANGRPRRVTDVSEPDLFWAMRGGGGDYALVTAVEFDLPLAPEIYGGKMVWPDDRAAQVMAAFREITAAAPEELTLWWSRLHFGGGPPMVSIDLTYLGEPEAAAALLAPLDRIKGRIRDTRRPMRPVDVGAIVGEPTEPSPVLSHGELLNALTDADTAALLTSPIAPLGALQVRHLGGALARPCDSAAGTVTSPYYLGLIGAQTTPDSHAAYTARVRDYLDALNQSRTKRTPFTLLSPEQTTLDAFAPDTLTRLRATKRHWDPSGVFRSNFPVTEPAAKR